MNTWIHTPPHPPSRRDDGRPLRVLLILLEASLRRQIAAELHRLSPRVVCIEADDPIAALFIKNPSTLDLVAIDTVLLLRNGAAMATQWRRVSSNVLVLEIDPASRDDVQRLLHTVTELLAASGDGIAG